MEQAEQALAMGLHPDDLITHDAEQAPLEPQDVTNWHLLVGRRGLHISQAKMAEVAGILRPDIIVMEKRGASVPPVVRERMVAHLRALGVEFYPGSVVFKLSDAC